MFLRLWYVISVDNVVDNSALICASHSLLLSYATSPLFPFEGLKDHPQNTSAKFLRFGLPHPIGQHFKPTMYRVKQNCVSKK